MTSFGLFAFCTTLKKLNTLMANLLLAYLNMWYALFRMSDFKTSLRKLDLAFY